MDDLYTLDDLSRRLGNIPISTLKHRIQQLGIPAAARGSRNKLLFDPAMIEVLEAADRLIREGRGIPSVRRVLKLADAPAEAFPDPAEDDAEGLEGAVPFEPVAAPPAQALDVEALDRLSRGLEAALAQLDAKDRQLEAKDRQLDQLQEELRRALEAAATFQQKTFYLQGELQRLQGELRDARAAAAQDPSSGPSAWKRLWKKET